MTGAASGKIFDLLLGQLPVRQLNTTLELELDAGVVILSRAAQAHAAHRHPEDYRRLLPHLATIIGNPLYAGDDFRNSGKLELIGRVPGVDEFGLVAVLMERDVHGRYHIASFYPVSRLKIETRRSKGFLKLVVP